MKEDEKYPFNAQISALSLNKNIVQVTVTPAKQVGEPATVSIAPNDYIKVTSTVDTTSHNESKIKVERPIGHNQLLIEGTIGKDVAPYVRNITIEDPSLFTGHVFQSTLQSAGISFAKKKEVRKTSWAKGTLLVTHHSSPLSEMMVEVLKKSDNFYTEMLTKAIGAIKKGEGSWRAGVQAISEVLHEVNLPGTYKQVDGSGLSRFNLVTSNQIVTLLRHIHKKEYRDVFKASLPIVGVDRTLKTRMKDTKAANNLIAKTGSMSGINNLSGYLKAANGDELAFSILINGVFKSKFAKQVQDALVSALAHYPAAPETSSEISVVRETAAPLTYELSAMLDPLREDPVLTNKHISMIVTSLDRRGPEATLYEYQADRLLTPGTIIKGLTSIGALSKLGEDYSFRTEVFLAKPVDANGVVEGDVVLKGYGDPTLRAGQQDGDDDRHSSTLEQLAGFLKARGVKKVNGNIVADRSYYDKQLVGSGWTWDTEKQFAQVSALTSEAGKVNIHYRPGLQVGAPVVVNMHPKTSYITLRQDATTAKTNNTFRVEKERGKNVLHIRGELPIQVEEQQEPVSVEEPALYTGEIFLKKMQDADIEMASTSKVLLGEVPIDAIKLGEVQSASLKDLLVQQNKKDDPLFAEMINKAIGVRVAGKGTTESGIAAIRDILNSWGVSTSYDMLDASGISLYNLLSARQLNDALVKFAGQAEYAAFYHSLPIAGVDGTLKDRLKYTDAQGNLRALSDRSLSVSSITGYMTTKKGERLAVTLIVNGDMSSREEISRWEDKVMEVLASYSGLPRALQNTS